jgi:hypothetical protein
MHKNEGSQRNSVKFTNATPLQFVTQMKQAEQEAGATTIELRNLTKCMDLLLSHEQKRMPEKD